MFHEEQSYADYLAFLDGLQGIARYPYTALAENPPDTLREYRRPFTEEEWYAFRNKSHPRQG